MGSCTEIDCKRVDCSYNDDEMCEETVVMINSDGECESYTERGT